MYSYYGFWTTFDELAAFAWSAPMRDLAARFEMSDTGLKRLLRGHGVEPPPQGYWNKLQAGRPVPKPAAAPPRRPGGSPYIWVDQRFKGVIAEAPPLSPDGPFASALVPEDLEELRALELQAIGKVAVPRDLSRPAGALAKLLAREERLAAKRASSAYPGLYDSPVFANPFDQRRLRIANGLIHVLAKRGVAADVDLANDDFSAHFRVGRHHVGVTIDVAKGRRQRGTVNDWARRQEREGLPRSTPLGLWFTSHGDAQLIPPAPFQDDADGTLETKLAAVAAHVIVAGEEAFRTDVRVQLERREAERWRQEEACRERQRKAEAERLEALKRSGELLRQAGDIRRLIAEVKAAVAAGTHAIGAEELAAWEAWASAYADSVDPVLSGQVMAHLRPPVVE